MKRALLGAVLVAVVAVGVYLMAELTQNRPDAVSDGSVSTVSFTVSTRGAQRGEPAAAAALWSVCAATVPGAVSDPVAVGGVWQTTVTPAVGANGRKRLIGCLEDATLDRVVGRVVSVVAS